MSEPIDPILARAEARRDEIAQELQKIKDWIAAYHTFENELKLGTRNTMGTLESSPPAEKPVDGADSDQAREAEAPDAASPRRVRVTDNPKPAFVVEQTIKVIREAGRPLTRREIHKGLSDRGVVVRGADEIKALGTMLWRSGADQLEQIEGRGYWPKDDPPTWSDAAPLSGSDRLGDLLG